MEQTKEQGEGKQPDGPLFAPQRADDLSSHLLRQALGYLGVFLPLLVYGVAGLRSTEGSPGWAPLDSISEYYYSGSVAVFTGVLWAIGAFLFTYRGYDNPSRHWIAESCAYWGAEILTVVHPRAAVSRAARVERGTVVMANATANADAVVGEGVIVNSGAVVEHDVEVGEYAHVAPNATMGGGSTLGAFSHLGIGASVLPCVHIGARTVVGAGAVVVKNLPDEVVAMGVPARIHRPRRQGVGPVLTTAVRKVKL